VQRIDLRGDWFVATASRPPLYHQLLQLPGTERELEKALHIDVEADIRSERVARVGFNESGVSRNNRLIERHKTSYGAYWKSYDFAENSGPQNLFERPLGPGSDNRSFRHAGGEIIFNLPNGLQGYMLVNGNGQRLDKGPTDIVSDPKRPDRAVENGLSCMSCHSRGVNPKADQIRTHVLLRQDAERFEKAAAATGAKVGATEPVMALAAQFESPLDLRRAAAGVGLRPEDFQARLEKSPEIGRTIGALKLPGGTVQRQTFVRVFPTLVSEWEIGSPATGKVEVKLPEPFAQVRTGGAGRYLIFHFPGAKKLAVLDVSQAKVVHEIEVPNDVRYAAGLDKLMVVVPGQRLLQRWDLRTFRREKTVPVPEGVLSAQMGSGGRGPLLLFIGGRFVGWDVERMEPADMDTGGLGGFVGYGPLARISADGQAVVVWQPGQQYVLVRLRRPKNTLAKSPDVQSVYGHWALPNADASLVFRFGGIHDGDMRALTADAFQGLVLLPTEDPRFFLALKEESRDTNRVLICASADRQVVLEVPKVEKMTGPSLAPGSGLVGEEPRVHYLPSAHLLVTLPESNDRVVVRSLNLIEALKESGRDYLFVLSRPSPDVAAGALFSYRMDVHSRADGLRYTLESGPKGMTVSDDGVVRWRAPSARIASRFASSSPCAAPPARRCSTPST
jgi:hypothetical protein